MKNIAVKIILSLLLSVLLILISTYIEIFLLQIKTTSYGIPLRFLFDLCPNPNNGELYAGCTGIEIKYLNLFINFIFWFALSHLFANKLILKIRK